MKEATALGDQIEEARRHLTALMDRAALSPGAETTLSEALEAFSSTLEELRVAEAELREQNEQLLVVNQALENERFRYQELFESEPLASVVTDIQGVILEANRAVQELLGLQAQSVINKPLTIYVRQEDHPAFLNFLDQVRSEPAKPHELEIGLRPRVKAPFPAWVRVAVVHNSRRQVMGLRWLIRDLTESKRAQERALQSERLAAIGQMVAGLAHESGNALQRSQACSEMLILQLQDQPKALGLVNTIQQAQTDLQRLYDEVRGYAASMILKREKWELREVLRTAWAHLTPMRQGRKVEFREIGAELEPIAEVDAFALEQVFRNILENSLSVCADPVKITVWWREYQIDSKPAWKVAISDNGPGMTDEQKARIFEPFYTTKTRGTGLGMAIAKRIVEAHGGGIAPGPSPGPGAEIVLTLPKEP